MGLASQAMPREILVLPEMPPPFTLFQSIPPSLWAQPRLVVPYTDTTTSCSLLLSTLMCIHCVPGPGREHRQKTHVGR